MTPSRSEQPRDYGDALHDELRADAVRSIVQALRSGFVVPANEATPESDLGSTAGLVYDTLRLAGFTISRDVP